MTTRYLLVFVCLLSTLICNAQDIIVLKNGSTIQSKVTEVSTTEIHYRKWSNLEGPIYVLGKSDIFAINYENGDKDLFNELSQQSNNHTQVPVQKTARVSAQNDSLIKTYNRIFSSEVIEAKNKEANSFITKFAFTQESVISNEHIEISFNMPYFALYEICLTNKTATPITVDLMNTFRSDSDGTSRIYYDASETISITSGEGSFTEVDLGIISAGEAASISKSKTYNNQRYLIIPPKGTVPLGEWRYAFHSVRGLNDVYEWITHGEHFSEIQIAYNWRISDNGQLTLSNIHNNGNYFLEVKDHNKTIISHKTLSIKVGDCILYDVNDTPLKKDYIISYKIGDSESSVSYSMAFSLYIRQVIGQQLNHNSFYYNCDKFHYNPRIDIIGNYHIF